MYRDPERQRDYDKERRKKDKEKRKAYQKEYREKNREKLKAYDKERHKKDKAKRTATAKKSYQKNRDKRRAYQKQYYTKNTEKIKATGRRSSYGLSDFDYNRMSDVQEFACAICQRTPEVPGTKKAKPLATDHCHKTSKVRGLLCSQCNHGLGNFKDSLGLLRNALQYLLDRG